MEHPRIRLGTDDVWLELTRTGTDSWRITANWCSWLTADFTADLGVAEVEDFVARMLSRLRAPSGVRFSAAVTPGRNNPLTLRAEPVGDGFAFFVRLTPNGDDDVCHLQMEIDPIATVELRETFGALHTALMA
ncbi:hypothetical protein FRZ03_20295 [Streptomyces misionensis]|uniref:Uncharacterized protein n=1 Tax=Streptomyces misionensis TaxID=67331 RepID=A0A5C6JLM3_9ACTN|nr:hypothetical protein [Streptomyces misionensis]TWV41919.1 hypothetical protein FRZ03_20295 [Streptomyces misionensis]